MPSWAKLASIWQPTDKKNPILTNVTKKKMNPVNLLSTIIQLHLGAWDLVTLFGPIVTKIPANRVQIRPREPEPYQKKSWRTWRTQGKNPDCCENPGKIVGVLENVLLQILIAVDKKLGINIQGWNIAS